MISILICGLVRDQHRLMDKVCTFGRWRSEGYVRQVVYSTWIGEVDRYSGLRHFLKKNSIQLIEVEEPKLVLKGGHQLHQMLSLHYGLEAIHEDDFVLKTRVDLADNNESMLKIFKTGTSICDDFLKIGLANKILVESARMELPFLCTDAQFLGSKDDLKRLVNLSAEFELLYNNLAVEQCFFFNPFRNIGLFKRHFYWNLPHFSELASQRSLQTDAILSERYLLDVLTAWWIILDSYFQIGWDYRIEPSDHIQSLRDGFELNSVDKRISNGDSSGIITNSVFVTRLLAILGSGNVARVKNTLLLNNIDASSLAIPADVFQVYEKYRQAFSSLPSPKAVASGSAQAVIKGVEQHFFLKDRNNSAATRYHEQITYLRREIDALKDELVITRTHSSLHRILSRILSQQFKENIRRKHPRLLSFYLRYFKNKSVRTN